MKKILLSFVTFFLLCSVANAGMFGGFGFSGGGSGVSTASDCSTYTAIGQLCQDTDDGKLYKGTGSGILELGAGASFDPAEPGAIGGTTPAAGTFTTLTAASFTTSAADGSRSMIFSNNTSYAPGVGENSLYFEGNVCKVSQNGAESTVQTVKVEKLAVFSFSGGGSDIADNTVIDSYNPTAATITGVVITASDSSACSAVVDIWADSYANFPATVADTITASAKPTLSSALVNKDTTLTGWTTAIAADSFLRANYDSGDCTGTVTVTIFGTR